MSAADLVRLGTDVLFVLVFLGAPPPPGATTALPVTGPTLR